MAINKKSTTLLLQALPFTAPLAANASQWGEENWGALEWEPLLMSIPIPALYSFILLLVITAIVSRFRR